MVSTMKSVEEVTIPEGYKQTEVGVIPEDWEQVFVGDISDVKTGPFGSALHEKDYVVDGTPIITVEHLGELGVTYQNLPMVSDLDRKRLNAYALKKGDIVFSRVGSIDRNALIRTHENDWLFSGRLLRVRLNDDKNVPEYLSYQFHSAPFKKRVVEVAVGQTMPSLNTAILKGIKFALPSSKKEQTAIANALSDVDNLIAALETLIAKKSAIKTAAMQQLLTGKKRLPAFVKESEGESDKIADNSGETQSVKPSSEFDTPSNHNTDAVNANNTKTTPRPGYKHTELGEIPEDWEVVELLDIVNLYHGKAHEPFVVDDGEYTVVNSKFVSTEGRVRKACSQNVCPARVNDVLMVLSDLPNGKALAKCYLVEADNIYAVNQRVCIYRSVKVDPEFLFYKINRHDFFLGLDDGVTQTHILNGDIAVFKLYLPMNKEEQAAIANVLSDMDTELEALQQRLSKTQKIKQGMMQELLTGKTRLV